MLAFQQNSACAEKISSGFILGPLGLNTTPNARMDKTGTARLSLSTLDPYMHGSIGFQFTDGLYLSLRQTTQISDFQGPAKTFYPDVDMKVRLWQESDFVPEISLGLQSALGHKRMAGEYIAFSKRYKNWDATAGIGWGRYGSADHASNPLKVLGKHFEKNRDKNSASFNSPGNWFSGDSIGFFGGVEYDLPWPSLSLKLDYNSDHYAAEKSFDSDTPSPWGFGLSYSPRDWINAGIGIQGTDKVTARLAVQPNFNAWPLRSAKVDEKTREPGHKIKYTAADETKLKATVALSPWRSLPEQMGHGARFLSASTDTNYQNFELTPTILGLRGPALRISRKTVDKSADKNGISPEEIWKNVDFVSEQRKQEPIDKKYPPNGMETEAFYFTLENQLDLAEENPGVFYRTSLLAQGRTTPFLGFLTVGGAMRLNIADNLDKMDRGFAQNLYSARSETDAFTHDILSLDSFYTSYTQSITPEFHGLLTAGYLEEQYEGLGGELLYRPFSSRFALGIEAWALAARDPDTMLNLGQGSPYNASGHVNGWYDIPEQNITLSASFGRFLAGDTGGTIGIEKTFENGARLNGFVTLTNGMDEDWDDHTAYHGIQFHLPLGSLPYVPEGSSVNTEISPLLRNAGQRVRPPLQLFALTESFTLDHVSNRWSEIMP